MPVGRFPVYIDAAVPKHRGVVTLNAETRNSSRSGSTILTGIIDETNPVFLGISS